MFKHYLVTAYKVLLRRKFFSFVNLFGIAITLAVLTAVIAIMQNYIQPIGAESNAANYLSINRLRLTNEERSSSSSWALGYRFYERYVENLELPDEIGLLRSPVSGTVFVDGHKIEPRVISANAAFFRIMTYEFLEGGPFDDSDEDAGRTVAVINEAMREAIFAGDNALGQTFNLNGRQFTVVGVVANEPELRMHSFGEIWVPHSSAASDGYRQEWVDGFSALLFAHDKSRLPAIRDEYAAAVATFEYDDPEQYQIAISRANTKFEVLAADFTDSEDEPEARTGLFMTMLVTGVIAFMFLPIINLINLNVSRIMERASEIGVRKAFGASMGTLVGQFVVENLVLSVLGGIVGYLLGLVLLNLISASGLIAYARFETDLTIFLAAFAMMVVFGLLSGIYPAAKMARMDVVTALKKGQVHVQTSQQAYLEPQTRKCADHHRTGGGISGHFLHRGDGISYLLPVQAAAGLSLGG